MSAAYGPTNMGQTPYIEKNVQCCAMLCNDYNITSTFKTFNFQIITS